MTFRIVEVLYKKKKKFSKLLKQKTLSYSFEKSYLSDLVTSIPKLNSSCEDDGNKNLTISLITEKTKLKNTRLKGQLLSIMT